MQSATSTFIAKTFQGLEEVLASEIAALGGKDIETGRRMVSFTGDKELLYKTNLHCRTALRILKPIYTFTAGDPDELYAQIKAMDWTEYLTPEMTFSIDPVVYSDEFRHSKFVTYRAKDAIADFFNERFGKRPSVRLSNADILINLHINQTTCTLSLDSSGESLHRRGYRTAQTEAPLNEVLAAVGRLGRKPGLHRPYVRVGYSPHRGCPHRNRNTGRNLPERFCIQTLERLRSRTVRPSL